MKAHQIVDEHKKGVRAKKYNKKPKAYITPKKPLAGPGQGGSYGADAGYSGVSEDTNTQPQLMTAFTKFLPLVMHALALKKLPKIKLEKIIIDHEQPTFGKYDDSEQIIYLAIENRHALDILRTLAHELIHFKQNTEHRLDHNSGGTGSEIENEANAQAAIIMRHFNKKYPEFFKDSAVDLEEDFDDDTNKVDPGTPIPYPKGTVKVDVDDVYDWYKLGMNISDLDDADPKDFGRGPPQTVISFGSEPLEHKYLAQLKRLGLPTHDIDENIIEAAYKGNIGAMEMFKFYSKASDNEKMLLKKLIAAGEERRAWQLIQKVSGVKLVGKEFDENFADGKNPQDKGDSKRHGVPTKASVSTLRKVAKQGGRKGQLAHWMANMKSGREK